jgi:hypothetical protein
MGAGSNRLDPGESLSPGQYLLSDNGAWIFMIPPSGAPTIYDVKNRQALYNQDNAGGNGPFSKSFADSANAQKWRIAKFIMQGDGNVVGYDASGSSLWSLDTYAGGTNYGFHRNQGNGNYLVMQDDGNLVVYDKDKYPIWDKRATGGHGGFFHLLGEAITGIPGSVAALTQSPAWQVIAAAAIFIPGIGVAVSAGMEAAALAGKVIQGKVDVLDAASQGLSIAGQSGLLDTEAVKAGFQAGIGTAIQNPTAKSLKEAYDQLAGDSNAQAGFDAAVAILQGSKVAPPPPPAVQSSAAKAGYYAQVGAPSVPSGQPSRAVSTVASKTAAAAAGAVTALKTQATITSLRAVTAQATQQQQSVASLAAKPEGFFHWLVRELRELTHL